MNKIPVLISAAEHSADMHAANLVRAVLEVRDDVEFHGFGGPRLRAAGCHVHVDLLALASMVLGFLGHLPRYFGVVRRFDRMLRELRPAAVVLVDSPGLHFILARLACWRGVPVVYYICPQIWAWAPWRRGRILRYTDLLLSILPFETEVFANARVPVEFVGHPLGDELAAVPPEAGERLREELGLARARDGLVLGVLPGSREREVDELMPILRELLDTVGAGRDELRVLVSCCRDEFESPIRGALAGTPVRWDLVRGDSRPLVLASDLLLSKSGTATLEAAFFERPMVVFYQASALARFFYRRLVVSPYFSLPNLLGASLFDGEAVVDEVLCRSRDATPLVEPTRALLEDDERRRGQRARLRMLRERFLVPGASARAARAVIAFLDGLDRGA